MMIILNVFATTFTINSLESSKKDQKNKKGLLEWVKAVTVPV
jgi:hypothetical protein